jgi:exopolysaccharide biosynthesis predicted pyruvyltransferase EpsI
VAKIIDEIQQIASSYEIFQCVECAAEIQNFLIDRGISGQRIKLDLGFRDLPWSVIYDLKRSQQIATNGLHEGILVYVNDEEIVFDNIEHTGINKVDWLRNLTSPTIELGRGKFKITEELF